MRFGVAVAMNTDNDDGVCPCCGKKMVEFKIVKDVKKGSRVCPIGFGTCDVSVAECNPNFEMVENGFLVFARCPHLKVKKHRHLK